MDLTLSNISSGGKTSITIKLINTATNAEALKVTLTDNGKRTYNIPEGSYNMVVTMDKANGNEKYKVDLLMPTEELISFAEEEVPLAVNYIVKAGDWLMKIARELFNGVAERWIDIYEFNKDVIGDDPNLIHAGQEYKIKAEWYGEQE